MRNVGRVVALGFAVLASLGLAWLAPWRTAADPPLAAEVPAADLPRSSTAVGAVTAAPEGAPERSEVAGPGCELAIRLRSACVPIGPLSICLGPDEGSADGAPERRLSVRERATLPDMAPGRYRLGSAEHGWRGDDVRFEIGRAERRREVVLALEPEGGWRGRAVDLESGAPLARARLVWEARGELADLTGLGGAPVEGEVGRLELELEDGRFALGSGPVLGDESRLTLDAEGYGSFTTPWIRWSGEGWIELGDVGLVHLAARGPALSGTVVDAELGDPLANVCVTPLPVGTRLADLWIRAGAVARADGSFAPSARSDARGRFELEARGPELVQLAAFLPSHGLVLSDPVPQLPGAVVRMARRAVLRGRVVAGEAALAATPLLGVLVAAGDRTVMLELDANLAFELGGLGPGRVRVALQALQPQTDGSSVSAEVLVRTLDLQEGEVRELELRYPADLASPRLRGQVLLPADVEFSTMRAALWVFGEAGPSAFAVIDRAGGFELEAAASDGARLFVGGSSADSSRAYLALRELDARAAETIELDVRFPRVFGVARAEGVPARRVSLVWNALESDSAWTRAVAEGLSLTTDDQGAFEVFGLRAGRYEVGRLGGPRRILVLTPGEIGPVELHLE